MYGFFQIFQYLCQHKIVRIYLSISLVIKHIPSCINYFFDGDLWLASESPVDDIYFQMLSTLPHCP